MPEKLESAGHLMHQGEVPAGALLYTPLGWVSCEKSQGVCYFLKSSAVVAQNESLKALSFMIQSINSYQSSAQTKAHPQYKGMLATEEGLKKALSGQSAEAS